MTNQQPPVIIIGAGRSGTNMLRDILVRLPGLETWPCDEINYIWRHGNRGYPTDQFSRDMATPRVADYIRRQFVKLARATNATTVVEKTCANSLRCGFIDQIFPDARFIHIVRDGRDAALSANLRWKAKLDVPYILRKARYVPPTDLPFYGGQYFGNRVRRLFSKDGRLAFWGPRFDGMQAVFENHGVAVACAIQWQVCVESATRQLAKLASDRVCTTRYEDFTGDPVTELERITEFLGVSVPNEQAISLSEGVSRKSVGNWRTKLDRQTTTEVERQVGETLRAHGYDSSIEQVKS
ncbi:sulfotransferase family protein [Rhodopirellula sallentina]|uniref:Sulfotransferase n=1 Tax=Rhodopirellula sallentina SM41 TaxID=1263870 RepID=M5U4X1_9BACT|nr:sulfotransferase [Rhodopirellula sallentina]EMI56507.1 Sulfotransferase [Rhodopirellula sallentina SM41]